jgi:uncharacterized protein with LGFP repeats
MLVNHGLSAIPDMARAADNGDGAQSTPTDVVESFKRLVATDVIADRDLVATVVAFSSPLDLATYFINAKYSDLGGASGSLGSTTSAVVATSTGTGFVRTFQHGAIYFHAQVGAHAIYGPIRTRWDELGAEKGFLGFPTSDVTPGADVRAEGSFAHFQGGSIYWTPIPIRVGAVSAVVAEDLATARVATSTPASTTPATGSTAVRTAVTGAALSAVEASTTAVRPTATTSAVDGALAGRLGTAIDLGIIKEPAVSSAGAYEVHGAIRQKYLALGAETSILGYPRSDETGTPDGVGRFNHFQGGSIYWTPGTSAHEVHGLIRDYWAQHGWERNPQIGYPITDELIPDRRVGHRRPEVRKKPIVDMPVDRIKLPADAVSAGFPSTVVNRPPAAGTPASSAVARAVTPAATPIVMNRPSALGRLSALTADSASAATSSAAAAPATRATSVATTISSELAAISVLTGPASTPADVRSVNRFADFESGVLFWLRGATAASMLSPIASTSDGTSLSFSGADIAAAAIAKIGRATFEQSNVALASATFVGTTGYSFDGAQVHNRRHRVQLIVRGVESLPVGLFGATIPTPVTATIELQIEVWFDPSQRRIALTPTDWTRTQTSSSSYGATVDAMLRSKLDPLLWSSYELLTLPDTDGGDPIAVLSVKTLVNGAVGVFVEPRRNLVVGTVTELANAVAPAVLTLAQPK